MNPGQQPQQPQQPPQASTQPQQAYGPQTQQPNAQQPPQASQLGQQPNQAVATPTYGQASTYGQHGQPIQPPNGYANQSQNPYPNQNPNINYGQQQGQPKKTSSKTVIIIVIAVVVGLSLFGVAGVIGLRTLANIQKAGQEDAAGGAISQAANSLRPADDVINRTDGTLDVSKLIESRQAIKAQSLKAKINQQVNLSDGSSFMVTGAERNFISPSKYLKAAEGKELIKVSIVVGNRNRQGDSYFSGRNFAIKNSAGGLVQDKYATTEDLPSVFKGATVSPGKQAKGDLVYEVDKGEKVSFVSEAEYENYDTKEVVKIQGEVTL